jgi:heavy metal sensor kinase
MNARSLQFRLTAWYAGVLAAIFIASGFALALGIRSEFSHVLLTNQERRARQIGETLVAGMDRTGTAYVAQQIETFNTPVTSDRFIRITRIGGPVVYLSGQPRGRFFDVTTVGPAPAVGPVLSSRRVRQTGNRSLLIATYRLTIDSGGYLVEVGVSGEPVDTAVRQLSWLLAGAVPMVILITAGGGYLLIRRSLRQVAQVTRQAESITQQNLSRRLPHLSTGDELEELSLALNRMIDRLEAAFQNSKQFLADASHELRTPLTVLRAELEELAREQPDPAERADRLGSVLEEVERLARIVEQLFALSRLDAGEAQENRGLLDLGQLAAGTVEQMRLLGEDRHIAIACRTSPAPMRGDSARLKQVLVNLLDNAIKYTLPGGAIEVVVQPEGEEVVLTVSDTGIGIPAAALPHVFKRFYRADPARSRETEGAGLGLAIARSICLAHGGTIEAASPDGRGTRIEARFPRFELSGRALPHS